MHVIFQPERVLLKRQIKKYSSFVSGVVLDAGSGGFDRYSELFKFEKYIRLDVDESSNPDIVASAEKIPLEDKSVDTIVSMQVLGDVKNLNKAIFEFFRVLKPGGVVLLTESLMSSMHDEPFDFWRFTNFSLESLFESAGFKIEKIEERGGFWTSCAQNSIRYLIDRFDLYDSFLGKILWLPISLFSRVMMFLDSIDKSKASKKQTMGWLVIAKKNE